MIISLNLKSNMPAEIKHSNVCCQLCHQLNEVAAPAPLQFQSPSAPGKCSLPYSTALKPGKAHMEPTLTAWHCALRLPKGDTRPIPLTASAQHYRLSRRH